MSDVDERLTALGVAGDAESPLALDSLARFELLLLLEDVLGRDIPLELVTSLRTVGDVRSWLSYLGAVPPTPTMPTTPTT